MNVLGILWTMPLMAWLWGAEQLRMMIKEIC